MCDPVPRRGKRVPYRVPHVADYPAAQISQECEYPVLDPFKLPYRPLKYVNCVTPYPVYELISPLDHIRYDDTQDVVKVSVGFNGEMDYARVDPACRVEQVTPCATY